MATARAVKAVKLEKARPERVARVAVTESNIRKAAKRVMAGALVSTEIQYLQHVMGSSATEAEFDKQVLAVRSMPWASIVLPD